VVATRGIRVEAIALKTLLAVEITASQLAEMKERKDFAAGAMAFLNREIDDQKVRRPFVVKGVGV
jgi:hypothetical protein